MLHYPPPRGEFQFAYHEVIPVRVVDDTCALEPPSTALGIRCPHRSPTAVMAASNPSHVYFCRYMCIYTVYTDCTRAVVEDDAMIAHSA